MRRVLIPHLYTKYDPITKQNVASIDLKEAQEYGELLPVVSGNFDPDLALDTLWQTITETFEREDYILAIGDPLMIGAALAYAADKIGGPINVLRWERNRKAYDVVGFEL